MFVLTLTLTSIRSLLQSRGYRLVRRALGQRLATLPFKERNLVQHHFNVFALLLEKSTARLEFGQKLLKLSSFIAREIIKIKQFAYLSESEP